MIGIAKLFRGKESTNLQVGVVAWPSFKSILTLVVIVGTLNNLMMSTITRSWMLSMKECY